MRRRRDLAFHWMFGLLIFACGTTHLMSIWTLWYLLMQNLLGDVWKYTGKHPTAYIEVGMTRVDGQEAFYVRDDGAGFDPACGAKLFGAFQRLHPPGDFEGTGVGLATVQRIIHRHGGRIWAEAAVEKGATFHFTLPTTPPS